MGQPQTLTYERDDRVGRITLNRPERGNGITLEMPAELADDAELEAGGEARVGPRRRAEAGDAVEDVGLPGDPVHDSPWSPNGSSRRRTASL